MRIKFDDCKCPKCGYASKSLIETKSPVSDREMYYVRCDRCGWETQKFFYALLAELSWIDEANIQ